MLRPFLLIGIGGSGGKTLRVIRENLERDLRDRGWPEGQGFPKAWQFLQIDVASAPDGDDPDLPPQLPGADFLGLVKPNVTYAGMDTTLKQRLPSEDQLDSLGGWRPDVNKVQVAITRGAGQYRSLGRVVALTRLDKIKSRVDRAVDAITGADVPDELAQLTSLLGQGDPRPDHADPVTVVVSSIAGGSGAGAVLDVCDVVRAAKRTWLDESVGILFAPDVFDEIPEAARRGVRPNALATLSELVAGGWSFQGREGGITLSSARLYSARGVDPGSIKRLGPRYPMLVGARNAEVAYGSQNEIYKGIGRAISEWMTSVQLQDSMSAYAFGNRQSTAASMADRLDLKQEHHEPPFSALGFARMSLGRDWFVRYSSQYLARAAAQRITTLHLDGRHPDDRRTDDEIVVERADQAWPAFIATSRLDERGTEANQVLDALRPSDVKARGVEWMERALLAIKTGEIPADGLPVQVWQDRIEKHLRERGPELREGLRSARLAQARAWVSGIQESLSEHIVDALATYGAPVTQQLLTRLSQELEIVVRELPEERGQQQQKSTRAATDIRAALSTDRKGRLAVGSPNLQRAVNRAAASVAFAAEADLIDLVESLLRDLRVGLVQPLTRAVGDALELLGQDSRRQQGVPSQIEFWPTGDEVPAPLRPPLNEFLLDEIESFPRTMRALLQHDTGEDVVGDAEISVMVDVITDADRRKALGKAGRPARVQNRTWVPAVPDLFESMANPAHASFTLNMRAGHLLERAEEWIKNDRRSFGRHLQQSLSAHLDDPNASPADQAVRLRRFAGQLKAAISRARPLVNIDAEVLSLVHDKDQAEEQLVIGPIPLTPGSPAANKAAEVLDSSRAAADQRGLFTGGHGQSVSVFGILTEPYEPVVFASLMKPLVDEWAEVRLSDDARQSFWTWRRSRPLPEFIPAAPAIRRAMIRGWLTAQVLGQIQGHDRPNSAIRIWAPGETGGAGGWKGFPHPLLRNFSSTSEAASATLESLPLALLEVFATRSLSPMHPFHRLRDLGTAGHLQGVESYELLNEELANWVTRGKVKLGAPVPHERVGLPTDEPEARRKRVIERFQLQQTRYRTQFVDLKMRADLVAVPRDFELRRDILEALEDLIEAVEASATTNNVDFA